MATLNDCAVGDIVKLHVGGVPTEFIVIQKGVPEEGAVEYSSSTDGVWLITKDIYECREWDEDDNDYANSDIHVYLNSTFLGLFEAEVQSQIIQAKIPYTNGTGTDGTVKDGTSGLSAKIFLLASNEIRSNSGDFNTEGVLLPYFTTSSNRVAYYKGNKQTWFTRTPYTTNDTSVRRILTTGGAGSVSVDYADGIRPALILPYTVTVTNGYIGTVPVSFNGNVTIGGVAKTISSAHVNVGGVWKEVSTAHMNIGGTWKPMA